MYVRQSSIALPRKPCRTSASRKRKEVTTLNKTRLIVLLLIASLLAFVLAHLGCWNFGTGMSSGGGF
jgi:hypothetical protein